jgi:hypothetical protein
MKFNLGDRVVTQYSFPGRSGVIIAAYLKPECMPIGMNNVMAGIKGFCESKAPEHLKTEDLEEQLVNSVTYVIKYDEKRLPAERKEFDQYRENFPSNESFEQWLETRKIQQVWAFELDLISESEYYQEFADELAEEKS